MSPPAPPASAARTGPALRRPAAAGATAARLFSAMSPGRRLGGALAARTAGAGPALRRLGATLAMAAALALPGLPAAAQDDAPTVPAQLAAERISIGPGNRLVAEGAVEMLHRGSRLRARRLVYTPGSDGAPDRLDLDGPIVLEDGARVLLLADAAALSADLRDGVLTGARMLLDERLQLAAREIGREGGRFTRLEGAVASSCRVCAGHPVPLWEIGAERVTHDAEARTLLFERAAFRVAGRTLVVVPQLRMPEPGVRRATGLLTPDLRSTSALGPGVSLPWFVVLGDSRDLTLTPRLHARGSATLGGRYRQAFARGWLELEGAVTRDRLRPGRWRGQLEATGAFRLRPDTHLGLALQLASDPRYRSDYGLGEEDIRTNTLFLEQARRDALGRLRITHFRSFRDDDDNAVLPNRVLEAGWARRARLPGLGGEAWLRLEALALQRSASDPVTGRDLARLSLRADWRRDWLLAGGLQAVALGGLQADRWQIRQDAARPGTQTRIAPAAGLELRWPLVRHDPGGARHLLEPVAQLVWTRPRLPDTPNEDSRLTELDEITLFRLQRGPGLDTLEPGARATLGLGWTRHDPAGWSLGADVGRVLRARPATASRLSGLAGRSSDWLAALRLRSAQGLTLAGRAAIAPSGRMDRQELRLSWTGPRTSLAGGFVHLAADPAEGRSRRVTELGLDGSVALDGNWTVLGDLRYDLARDEPGRAGLGARFRNECLAADVSLSRRFVSSTTVSARTEFGVRVELIGFGAREGGPPRPCVR